MEKIHQKTQRYFMWLRPTLAILSFGLFAVLSLGLTLLYNFCGTDVVLYTSVLPEILKILIDLTEIAIYAICFSIFLAAAFYSHLNSPRLSLLWIYLGALLFRRLCDLLGVLILYGSLDSLDLTYALIYFLLDAALALAVFLLAQKRARKFYFSYCRKDQASSLFKDEAQPLYTECLHPFSKIYDKTNPLQVQTAVVSVILMAIKLLSRILYDVDYGAPEDFKEILIMAVYYLSDVLLAVIFYVLSILVLNRLFRRGDGGRRTIEK